MTRLHDIISLALDELGDESDISLGRGSDTKQLIRIEEWRTRLFARLEREAHLHKWLLLIIILACLLLFFVGLFILIYYRNSPGIYQLVFGGGALAGMLMVLNTARQALTDKAGYDVLIAILPDLPPDQVVAALKNMKYQRIDKQ
jgi:hypothetical protein